MRGSIFFLNGESWGEGPRDVYICQGWGSGGDFYFFFLGGGGGGRLYIQGVHMNIYQRRCQTIDVKHKQPIFYQLINITIIFFY